MLQQGFELLAGKLLMFLEPVWPEVIFLLAGDISGWIPKPGKPLSQAKSLRPISLMSYTLKTLQKLLDLHQEWCFG